MRLVSKEFSQVGLIATFTAEGSALYLPQAIAALKERYGFLDAPETLRA